MTPLSLSCAGALLCWWLGTTLLPWMLWYVSVQRPQVLTCMSPLCFPLQCKDTV